MCIFQLICTLTSTLVNLFLIYLIIKKSSNQIGNYKYLMIYTSVFEAIWGIFDFPADIKLHCHGHASLVFRESPSSTWIVVIYTGLFGASMAVFGVNFAYRYGSIEWKFGNRYTSGWMFHSYFATPVVVGVWWANAVKYGFQATRESDEYSRPSILTNFYLPIENISYISANFYHTQYTTFFSMFNWPVWIGAFNLMLIVVSSLSCIFTFGFFCYKELSGKLESKQTSLQYSTLQKQIFLSLVFQTAIPLSLMHLPITIYFVVPILNLNFDIFSGFFQSTISLYPAVDPLPNFFIIKNYRKAILNMIRVKVKPQEIPEIRLNIVSVTVSKPIF